MPWVTTGIAATCEASGVTQFGVNGQVTEMAYGVPNLSSLLTVHAVAPAE